MKNDDYENLRKIFVSLERYITVERVVFGTVGIILTSVITGIVYILFKR